jgi:hypothetical protein
MKRYHPSILIFAFLLLPVSGLSAQADSTSFTALEVTSEPPGAHVFIDGVERGRAPIEGISLPRGTHIIDLRCDGYVSIRDSIASTAEGRVVRHYVMVVSAAISITAEPAGSAVYLGGRFRGRTPFVKSDLPPGATTVQITSPGYYPWVDTLLLQSGLMEHVSVKLSMVPALLIIVPASNDIQIEVNGQEFSTDSVAGMTLAAGRVDVYARHRSSGRAVASTFALLPNSTLFLGVEFDRKSMRPFWHSLMYPGLGQAMAGEKALAWGYAFGFGVAGAVAGISEFAYLRNWRGCERAISAASETRDPGEAVAQHKIAQEKYDAAIRAHKVRNPAFFVALGIYVISALDALFIHNTSDELFETAATESLGTIHLLTSGQQEFSVHWRIPL